MYIQKYRRAEVAFFNLVSPSYCLEIKFNQLLMFCWFTGDYIFKLLI